MGLQAAAALPAVGGVRQQMGLTVVCKMSSELNIAGLDIPGLEKEINRIEAEEAVCQAGLAGLLKREDPRRGIFFAQEIHAMKQEKLRLHVEKEFCRKRIARLKFEQADF